MAEQSNQKRLNQPEKQKDATVKGRDAFFMDIDRMVNEGLGGGTVAKENGLIEEDTEVAKEAPPNVYGDKES